MKVAGVLSVAGLIIIIETLAVYIASRTGESLLTWAGGVTVMILISAYIAYRIDSEVRREKD